MRVQDLFSEICLQIEIPSLQYHYGICTYCSAAVESTGQLQAKAEAQSRAEAAEIEGEAAVEQAKLKAETSKIEAVKFQSGYRELIHLVECIAYYSNQCP